MSITVEAFLRRGFLPENLPPPISSTDIWPHYEAAGDAYLVTKNCVGAQSSYDASKRGRQRRVFGLPHPTFVHDKALFFVKHWNEIGLLIDSSAGSLSKPLFGEGPRAVRITPHAELPKLRLRTFSKYKYCAIADVSRFYPSIYTHTIPWAINGKKEAKTDHTFNSAKIFGNRLDFINRQAQDRQTIGIPVGPDTSRITAELILSAVDKSFLQKSGGRKKVTYLRHVDDYWIAGNTIEECEKHLQNLRLALHEFELALNDFKTKIVPTNFVFGESWPTEFEREIKDALQSSTREANAVATLSKIVDRATRENDDGMIRHVIRKIDENTLWTANWPILEHFLAQSAIQFSHSFDYVVRVVVWRLKIGKDVDKKLWIDVARSVAFQGGSLGRDSEVLWSLWLMKELGSKVPKELLNVLVRNSCALVLGYLAHMYANGLTTDKSIPEKLWEAVEGDLYAGRHWPLALELMHLDIPNSAATHSKAPDALRMLHDAKASLIAWDAAPKVFVTKLIGGLDEDDPEHAIEDFTSDYDSDSDDDGDSDVDFDFDDPDSEDE